MRTCIRAYPRTRGANPRCSTLLFGLDSCRETQAFATSKQQNKVVQTKKVQFSAIFSRFGGNILPYTYRGQRDDRSGCTAISRHLFSSLSDAYELPDTSFHAFATCCTREVLDCNNNFPHLCFSSKHKRGNDDAGCCAVPACCREGTGTIAQVVAECRLPSEGWRLLRIRANGIGWRRAPSCARCAWS